MSECPVPTASHVLVFNLECVAGQGRARKARLNINDGMKMVWARIHLRSASASQNCDGGGEQRPSSGLIRACLQLTWCPREARHPGQPLHVLLLLLLQSHLRQSQVPLQRRYLEEPLLLRHLRQSQVEPLLRCHLVVRLLLKERRVVEQVNRRPEESRL